jgi:hypothetical protein
MSADVVVVPPSRKKSRKTPLDNLAMEAFSTEIKNLIGCPICHEVMSQPVHVALCSHLVCLTCHETMRAKSIKLVRTFREHPIKNDILLSPGAPWKYHVTFGTVLCPLCKATGPDISDDIIQQPSQALTDIMTSLGHIALSPTCPYCQVDSPNFPQLCSSHVTQCPKRYVCCTFCDEKVNFSGRTENTEREILKALEVHLMIDCKKIPCPNCWNVGTHEDIQHCFALHKKALAILEDLKQFRTELWHAMLFTSAKPSMVYSDQAVKSLNATLSRMTKVQSNIGNQILPEDERVALEEAEVDEESSDYEPGEGIEESSNYEPGEGTEGTGV